MPACLHDVCSMVWCLHTCMMSAQQYDVQYVLPERCLPTSTMWCLPICITYAYLYEVCSTASCLPTSMMSSHLFDVASPNDVHTLVWCAQLYDVWLRVWCLLNKTYYVYSTCHYKAWGWARTDSLLSLQNLRATHCSTSLNLLLGWRQ